MKEAESTWSVARRIVKNDGLGFRGLNKGVTATMGRNGTFNMVYFGFYHSVKNYVPAFEDSTQEFIRKVLIGFTSGTLACFINIPFDVAKSRIQGPQPQAGVLKYKGTFRSIGIVYREEGFRALYKGLVPKVMRLGPGGAIMLLVFEYAYEFLQHKFLWVPKYLWNCLSTAGKQYIHSDMHTYILYYAAYLINCLNFIVIISLNGKFNKKVKFLFFVSLMN